MSETLEMVLSIIFLVAVIVSAIIFKGYAKFIINQTQGYNPHKNLPKYLSFGAVIILFFLDYEPLLIWVSAALFGVLIYLHSRKINITHAIFFSIVQTFAALFLTFIVIFKFVAKAAFKMNFDNSQGTDNYLERYANEREAASRSVRNQEEERDLDNRRVAHSHGVTVQDAKDMGIIDPKG